MSFDFATPTSDPHILPRMPSWISTSTQADEYTTFLTGAALSHLHILLLHGQIPKALLLDRLTLRAAENCVRFSGRPERASQLRDALHLLRSGDLPGPAGEIYLMWRLAVRRPVSAETLARALPDLEVPQIAGWLDAGQGGPVSRAATVLEAVLTDLPRSEVPALILADAVLAQALGWDYLVPLLASGLNRTDMRKRGEDLHSACHRAVTSSVVEAVRMAESLARQVVHLRTVAPKLRAKGAKDAVEIFMTQDAVAPTALPLPDRAARRLCDRLVSLGAIRELTGRETFRLYGV